jgi:hypothetical protein
MEDLSSPLVINGYTLDAALLREANNWTSIDLDHLGSPTDGIVSVNIRQGGIEARIAPWGRRVSRIDLAALELWAQHLHHANKHCWVAEAVLRTIFEEGEGAVLGHRQWTPDQLKYAEYQHVTVRYVNDALVWSEVLRAIDFRGQEVVELGPGRSVVLDMALAMLDFSGELLKVDQTVWRLPGEPVLRRGFSIASVMADVVHDTESTPIGDLLAMNHFVDDLFMGVWASAKGVDFFGELMDDPGMSAAAWEDAMAHSGEYSPTVMEVGRILGSRIPPNGLVVLRNYPSNYETHYRQVARINFTAALTRGFVEEFLDAGLAVVDVDMTRVLGPQGSKFPGSFCVLRRSAPR